MVIATSAVHAIPIQAYGLWKGDGGYSMRMDFTYNDIFPVIDVSGGYSDQIGAIISFTSRVYKDGKLLHTNDPCAINSYLSYAYMQFHFDTIAFSLIPNSYVDIGADPGYWIGGKAGSGQLGMARDFYGADGYYGDDETGSTYFPVDRGGEIAFYKRVPETGASIGLLALALTGLIVARHGRRVGRAAR